MKRLTGVTQRSDKGRLVAAAVLLGILTVIALFAPPTHAITTISQSYSTTDNLPIGSIVALKKNTTDNVQAANLENADNIFGVTINTSSSLLSIQGTQGQQVQVATQGMENVLVSDYNGVVKQGDAITASPIAGVGMKATDNIRIVGMAQQDMR